MVVYKQILLLGGNQGDVISAIEDAIERLLHRLGPVIKRSFYYESEPWGFEASQNFINQVVEFHSSLNPIDLLDFTQDIEKALGRKEKAGIHYESRPIDIDILFVDDEQINLPRLTVPHPKLHERRFTLLPLYDEWSGLIHPVLTKSISQLLTICPDKGVVKRVD